MHMQPALLMMDDANSVNDEAWYINTLHRSGVTKTPTLTPPSCQQTLMVDILGLPLSSCKEQCNTLLARRETGSNGCSQISSSTMKPWAQLFADTDEEMEKMTLREIQLSLRKASGRSVKKETSMRSAENHTPSVALELLWEDSTSNSSENFSFGKGASSTCDTSPERPQRAEAQIPKARAATSSGSRQKRSSKDSETVVESEVSEEDDWTLQKWQQLLKQDPRRKRLKKCSKLEEETSKSVNNVSSSDPSLVALDPAYGKISETKGSHSAGALYSHCLAFRDNSETDCHGCESSDQKAPCGDPMPPLEGVVQGESSKILASPSIHSAVRLELEDDSDLVTPEGLLSERLQMSNEAVWAFKPCSKVQSFPSLKMASAASHTRAGIKPLIQTSSRIASGIIGVQSSGAHASIPGQRKMQVEVRNGQLSPIPSGPTSDGVCKYKPITSTVARNVNADRICSSSVSATNLLECAASPDPCIGTKLPERVQSGISQASGKGLSNGCSSLDCDESLEIEEEQEMQREPAKIPCKRKAISPTSQEFLLKASKLGDSKAGTKGWINLTKLKRSKLINGASSSYGRRGQPEEALRGFGCYRKAKEVLSKVNVSSDSSPPEKHVGEVAIITSQQTSPHVQETVSTSPSEPQNRSKATSTSSPAGASPLIPAKGILRSSSQACQGPCICEGCASLRSRAERASEFSQRQMQDIEGLAVKLMKDLNILRSIVEDRLIQSPSKQHQSLRPNLSLDQLKKVTGNALETEETAKRWLVRMARDCNRYCKIMRMQGRKLTFADESGGKLCHVKVFQSEPILDVTTGPKARPLERNSCTLSAEDERSVETAQI